MGAHGFVQMDSKDHSRFNPKRSDHGLVLSNPDQLLEMGDSTSGDVTLQKITRLVLLFLAGSVGTKKTYFTSSFQHLVVKEQKHY